MKRSILLLAVVGYSVFACGVLSPQAAGQQPNIPWIVTDDHPHQRLQVRHEDSPPRRPQARGASK